MNTSVVVLAGGWSRERDVSLMGSECIASALRGAGYDVRVIDVQLEDLVEKAERVLGMSPQIPKDSCIH